MSTAVPLSVVIVGRRSFTRISPANNRKWLPSNTSTPNQTRFRLSSSSEPLPNQVNYAEAMQNGATDSSGSTEKGNEEPVKTQSSNDLMQKLKRYGVAGVLSYGLLNTVYYLMTFLIVWFYVAPAPARMGYAAAVERFLKVMAMVWAGSQVTKLLRAGGALALAPLVDNGLSWFTVKFKFQSKGKAFGAIAGICFALALLLFFGLTLLWA